MMIPMFEQHFLLFDGMSRLDLQRLTIEPSWQENPFNEASNVFKNPLQICFGHQRFFVPSEFIYNPFSQVEILFLFQLF